MSIPYFKLIDTKTRLRTRRISVAFCERIFHIQSLGEVMSRQFYGFVDDDTDEKKLRNVLFAGECSVGGANTLSLCGGINLTSFAIASVIPLSTMT